MKLVDDIRFYLSCLNYWQQQQEAAVLLREAATALEEMQRDSERLSNAERDAFGGQSLDAAACAAGGGVMEITVNADEAYYLTDALKHAIQRVEKHAKKCRKLADGGGAYSLTMRDAHWLQALLDEVKRKTPPLECP